MNDDSYQYIDDREGCGLSRPRGPAGVVGERSGDNDTQVTVTCCCCCALANYCQASCFIAATRNRPGQRAQHCTGQDRPRRQSLDSLSTRSSSWHRSHSTKVERGFLLEKDEKRRCCLFRSFSTTARTQSHAKTDVISVIKC